MVSADKNIVVYAEKCMQPKCADSCESEECKLCRPCLASDDIIDLHSAYREHINRGNTKRIFPVPMSSDKNNMINEDDLLKMTTKNRLITEWFAGKCATDSSWCS